MPDNDRKLIIYRDGRRFEQTVVMPLEEGVKGNWQTLAAMAKIVREDAAMPDLKRFIERAILPGINFSDSQALIQAAFNFCNHSILYFDDFPTIERIADLWSCLYALDPKQAIGDCVIKSVALATILATAGLKPFFVALQSDAQSTTFNHVFVGLEQNKNFLPLDPTPKNFKPGQIAPSSKIRMFPIFETASTVKLPI